MMQPATIVDAARKRELDEIGFCVLPGYVASKKVQELVESVEELYRKEGDNAGAEFRVEPNARRLANLLDKGHGFADLLTPDIVAHVAAVLGPDLKLSSFNARSANPYSDSEQPLHADMGAVPDERGYWVCNTVWMLDDFTEQNGALRVVPGSHRSGQLPQDLLSDTKAAHPDQVLVTGEAGTVVVMNAHLWHGGTANRTGSPRRALHIFFCRSDKPQQQYQKALLRREVQDSLSPYLRRLLALDDPHNDYLSAKMEKTSGFLK